MTTMPFVVGQSATRPSRLKKDKGDKYHLDYGKWAASMAMSDARHQRFIRQCQINWSFYKGDQHIFEEDLENFFLDDTGQTKNRIKVSKNRLQPMVRQFMGNAIRLSYKYKVKSLDDRVFNRREQELMGMIAYKRAAQALPEFADAINSKYPVEGSEDDINELFNATFIDAYEESMNRLTNWIAENQKFDEIKVIATQDLAVTGLCVYKGTCQNYRYMGKRQEVMQFFFDRGAERFDLSDAEYMGDFGSVDAPAIYERYNLTPSERTAIEKYATSSGSSVNTILNNWYNMPTGRPTVIDVYWKDTKPEEYGWVKNKYGLLEFACLSDDKEDEDDYTYSDLVEKSEIPDEYKHITKDDVKKTIYVDEARFATFVSSDEISHPLKGGDVLLDYGVLPYQQTDKTDPKFCSFPYKCSTWLYDKGDIIAPIESAISPQRIINRLLSIEESKINNSTGQGVVYAEEAMGNDGEEDLIARINKGQPISINAQKFGGVQNAIGAYGVPFTQASNQIFNTIREYSVGIQDVSGVNEAMQGAAGGSEMLVGVVEQQIARGSILQEPFYWALDRLMAQMYNHAQDVGKKVYADNPAMLSAIVGDDSARVINITKEMAAEQFRCFTERIDSAKNEAEKANLLLLTLVQYQLIDAQVAGELYGRSNPDQVSDAFRNYQRKIAIVRKQQAQQQEQAAAQAIQMQQKQGGEAMALEVEGRQRDQFNKDSDRQQKQENSERTSGTKVLVTDKNNNTKLAIEAAKQKSEQKKKLVA